MAASTTMAPNQGSRAMDFLLVDFAAGAAVDLVVRVAASAPGSPAQSSSTSPTTPKRLAAASPRIKQFNGFIVVKVLFAACSFITRRAAVKQALQRSGLMDYWIVGLMVGLHTSPCFH